MSNRHFHVGLKKGAENLIPETANENYKKYKGEESAIIAEQHDISIKEVIDKGLTEDEKKKYQELRSKDKNATDEQLLKKMGISTSDNVQGAPWTRKNANGEEALMQDASGNYMFSRMQQTLANMTNIGTDLVRD